MSGPWENDWSAPTLPADGPWNNYAPSQDQTPGGRAVPAGMRLVATTDDGGEVLEDGQGNRQFVGPSYSTTDPDRIAQIMEGATPAESYRTGLSEDIVDQHPMASRAATAFQGVPFAGSYLDEAASAMHGPQAGQAVRVSQDAMETAHPGQTSALRTAGTVAAAVPAAVAVTGGALPLATTRGSRMMQGALAGMVAGGTEGAIYGAGDQSGQGRLSNAQTNAVIGAGLGAAAGAGVPVLDEVIRRTLHGLRGSPERVIRETLDVSAETASVIRQTLDVGDLDAAAQALTRAGDNAMLADAGQPAREMLDAAANAGGQAGAIARDAVESRVSSQHAALTETLDELLGAPVGRDTTRAGIRAETAVARDTTYDAAYASPIDYASLEGQRLLNVIQNRVPERVIRAANYLMRTEGETSAQILIEVAEDGSYSFSQLPDVRQIDYITRALGDAAEGTEGRGALGGMTQQGRAYTSLVRDLRGFTRELVPAYGEALDTAADAISRSRAVETGYNLLSPRTTREAARTALEGATEAELAAARQGLRDFIDDRVANVTGIVSDPNMDARQAIQMLRDMTSGRSMANIQTLLGRREAEQLFEAVGETAAALELRAAIATGSRTAIRQSIQGSVTDQTAPGILEELARGSPVPAAQRFVQMLTGNSAEAQALRSQAIFEEIARVLTNTRGPQAQQALRTIQDAMDGRHISPNRAEYLGRVLNRVFASEGHQEAMRYLEAR